MEKNGGVTKCLEIMRDSLDESIAFLGEKKC